MIVKLLLRQLTISNFTLVGALDIAFTGGLTIVTGESGAGKSILLNALALVLGERANPGLIRPGAQRAEVIAEFDLKGNAGALDCLRDHELGDPDQPERCLLRRIVNSDGRSRAFVNGTPVNLRLLRNLASGLVDIHGQDENQRLTRMDVQLALLDAYAVAAGTREAMAVAYRAWKRSQRDAMDLERRLADIANRNELLRYQLAELQALNLREDEFEALDAEFRRLSQAHSIRETVMAAVECLSNLDDMRRVQGALANVDDAHPALDRARQALDSALELSGDALRDLRGYFDALEANPEHLAEVEERLNLVHELARKHQVHPRALAQHAGELQAELATLTATQEDHASLQNQAAQHRADFEECAQQVSRQRRAGATTFADAVSACMHTLGIKNGCLNVHFEDADSEQGLETAEFLVTANPGYAPGSLKKVASGGERARISLAIEIVAAERACLPCLVLDEADVGVGGPAADVIGRLLRGLGRHTQVICVTHAPQVAALGDAHFLVEKNAAQDIGIQALDERSRVEELARMLAGAGVTQKARAYAQTLRREAGG